MINDNAPKAIKQAEMKTLFGRKVAIDACALRSVRRHAARADLDSSRARLVQVHVDLPVLDRSQAAGRSATHERRG